MLQEHFKKMKSVQVRMLQNYLRKKFTNISCNFLKRSDFDIYALMSPTEESKGDFDDFFMADEDHLVIAVDYVSDNGVCIDEYLANAKKLIEKHVPAAVYHEDTEELSIEEQTKLKIAAWIGVVDLKNGELSYVSISADQPVIRKDGQFSFLEDNEDFKEYSIKLNKGDMLFLYSDSASKAVNSDGETYGKNRLLECLRSLNPDSNCREKVIAVKADIDRFAGMAKHFDDLTLLAFDYTPKNKERDIIEKTFDATVETLPEVIAFVEEQLEAKDASMKAIMTISVALEEMFVNIAHYAYPDGPGKATVGVSFDGDDVSISLTDKGIFFDPLAKEDPDVTARAEDREIGGLGIFMVKNSMDNCFYERRGDENIFVMKKRIR